MTTYDQQEPTEADGPAELRAHVKQLEEELAVERARNLGNELTKLGLDPDKGLGRSIVKDIARGDYEGDLSADALARHAETEYGEVLSTEPAPEPASTEPETDEAQEQLDQITQASEIPIPPNENVDVIGEMEREIRENEAPDQRLIRTSIAAKAAQLQEDWRAGRIHTTPEP